MIAAQTVTEVRRLLAEQKFSYREIARMTGISRGSVGAIASGKRPDYETLRRPGEDGWAEPTGPPVRCAGCGGRVYMPCQLCRVREAAAKDLRRTRSRMAAIDTPLGLDLRPEHHARYEQVLARRRAM